MNTQAINTAKSLQRIQNYLDRLAVAQGYHKECIHAFIGKDGAEIPLLATDLKAILQQVAATHPTQQGAADGFFLLLPQRPKPEAPAGTVGLDWDAYSGAQMLAFGRDSSDAAIAALRTEQHLQEMRSYRITVDNLRARVEELEVQIAEAGRVI